VIALFPADPPDDVAERLGEMRAARDARARVMLERLDRIGAPVAYEDVARRARGAIGRPHVADALVAAGHAADRADAFARLIGHDCPGYVPHAGVATRDAVAFIAASGGAPVLAHPATLRMGGRELDATVASLAAAGLAGIEVHRPEHTPEQRAAYADLAARHRLVASGGSDFHRPDGELRPGDTGRPPLPDGTADALLARAGGGGPG
jgi:predicted metal-dependent phosphoesterase TrpH